MSRKIFSEFVRFALVGIVSTAVNYGIFFVLLRYGGVHYLLASSAGFVVGIFVSYFLNRAFTFRSNAEDRRREFLLYVSVCLVSLGLSILTLRTCVDLLMMNPLLGNLFAIGVSTVSNFAGAKILIFKSSHIPRD